MRFIQSLLISILFLSGVFTVSAQTKPELKGKISISGAFALYPMAVKWSEEYRKLNPGVQIDLSAGGAGKGMTDVLAGVVDIALVSREINPAEAKKGATGFAVTKDAVVPTISSTNPQLKEILEKGITRDKLNHIFITGRIQNWQEAGFSKPVPLHVYTRSDACGASETLAHWFGKKQEDLQGVAVFGDPGLATSVKRDPVAIGYNNIGYVYDFTTKKPTNGVQVIPIDLNNNGKIDADENFYGDIQTLTDAIAAGKYPSPPARDLYFVTKGKPTNAIVIDFTRWVLVNGQQYVDAAGYVKLSDEKLKKSLAALN